MAPLLTPRRMMVWTILPLLLLLVAGHASRAAVDLALIQVTTTAILNDGYDGQCDLYEALQASFSNFSSGAPSTTYHECTAGAGGKEILFVGAAAGGIITVPTGAGSLDHIQTVFRGGLPFFLPKLNGARDIDLAPDGSSVHAGAYLDDAIVSLHTINAVPVLETLSPASAAAGASGVTLTLGGQSFLPGATAVVDGVSRTATLVNGTTLQMTLSAAELAAVGTAVVTVFNPGPGGGLSNPALFTISLPWQNPVPSVLTLTPPAVTQVGFTGQPQTVRIDGLGFSEDSVARWNGAPRPTTYIGDGLLEVTLTGVDMTPGGVGTVSVFNPAPGGGASNSVPFTVTRFRYGRYVPVVIR